jgi:outer membrane protein TolC
MTKKRSLLVLFAALLVPLLNVHGQTQPRVFTLEDAISIAQEQSPDALATRQTFRSSFWQYKSFRATYLPSMGANATLPQFNRAYTKYENPDGSISYVQQQYINVEGNLSLSQRLGFSGGTIYATSSLGRIDNYPFFTDSTFQYTTTPIYIGLSQPIFQFNPYRWDRKIQPLEYEQAKKKYLEDLEQISITTTNYYFNLLSAQIEKKIAQTNLSNYDTLYRIARGRYELGKIAENELLSLELNYLRAQADVENAGIGLDMALFRFRSFLRIKDTIPIKLIPPTNIGFFKVSPIDAVGYAKSNSSTFIDFDRRLLVAEKDVRQAKMDGRFDMQLNAGYGLSQTAVYNEITKTSPTIGDAYQNPSESQQLSLALTIPIYDWGVARGKIKVAEAQQELVRNSVEQEMLDFERNAYIKVLQFNMQENLLRIAAKSDTVAKKTYEVVKGRYLIGKPVSILELNDAQINTDNSEKNFYSSLLIYWRSYFELRKMTLYDFRRNRPLQFNIKDISL